MPNKNHFWTRDEDEAILGGMTYEDFVARYPDVTWNAFRFRRKRLLKEQEPITAPRSEKTLIVKPGDAKDYAGFDILFFDIETTFSTQPRMLCGSIADVFGNVETYDLYKYPGKDWLDDSNLVKAYADRLEKADMIVSWNGKMFDIPVINGRLLFHGEEPMEKVKHIDLMYYASGQFARIGRRSLESVSIFFGAKNHKTPLNPQIWDRADHGSDTDYQYIIQHCDADVLVLRDVFKVLKKQIQSVTR